MNVRVILLELHFHKYILYKNTTFVLLFTYLIALLIPFLVGQFKLSILSDVILVSIISSVVIVIAILFLNEFDYHLDKIQKELKSLK